MRSVENENKTQGINTKQVGHQRQQHHLNTLSPITTCALKTLHVQISVMSKSLYCVLESYFTSRSTLTTPSLATTTKRSPIPLVQTTHQFQTIFARANDNIHALDTSLRGEIRRGLDWDITSGLAGMAPGERCRRDGLAEMTIPRLLLLQRDTERARTQNSWKITRAPARSSACLDATSKDRLHGSVG